MRRLLGFITMLAVFAGSCSFFETGQNPAPDVDTQATIDAIVRKSAEETAAVQPPPTTVPPTQTATPVLAVSSPTLEATVTATSVAPSSTPESSSTAAPNLTTTPVTATSGPGDNPTATKALGSLTVTPTLGVLLYGTLPPAVPSVKITVVNKSRAQAYISLQNYPPDGPAAFLEYPVRNQVKVDAPLGYYVYVVWVGGRQITGSFTLHKDDDLTITIFKDKVEITK